jgi:hypothetical protein
VPTWSAPRIKYFSSRCHSGESRNLFDVYGIPAFAGMTYLG